MTQTDKEKLRMAKNLEGFCIYVVGCWYS